MGGQTACPTQEPTTASSVRSEGVGFLRASYQHSALPEPLLVKWGEERDRLGHYVATRLGWAVGVYWYWWQLVLVPICIFVLVPIVAPIWALSLFSRPHTGFQGC